MSAWKRQWMSCIFGDATSTETSSKKEPKVKDQLETLCTKDEHLTIDREGDIVTNQASSTNATDENDKMLIILEDQDVKEEDRYLILEDEQTTCICDSNSVFNNETTYETDRSLELQGDEITDDILGGKDVDDTEAQAGCEGVQESNIVTRKIATDGGLKQLVSNSTDNRVTNKTDGLLGSHVKDATDKRMEDTEKLAEPICVKGEDNENTIKAETDVQNAVSDEIWLSIEKTKLRRAQR